MATRADYKRLVKLKGYDGSADTMLNDAVQEGRRRLVQDHRWEFLQTRTAVLSTTPNSDTVSLASIADLAHVDAVRTALGECTPMDYESLRTQQVNSPDVAIPQYWAQRGNTLVFYPTPDVAYSLNIDYGAKLAPLPDDTTQDTFPDELQDLVAWAATIPLTFRQRDSWAMAAAEQQYQTLLRMAAGQENIKQRQGSRQVKSGYWGPRW